jgi:hypothetical protein
MSEEAVVEESAPESSGNSLIAEPAGNNPIASWRDDLSDDIKNDSSLSSFKDVQGLAKSYIHAQKMVGSEKVAKPRDDWSEADWNGHYDALGRPDSSDGYSTPPETDAETLKDYKKALYDAGVSSKQAEGLLAHFAESMKGRAVTEATNTREELNATREVLAQEYGREAPYKLDLAKSVINKFGSQDLVDALNSTGLGNNPELIKTFASIGELIVEDDVRGGRSTIHLDGPSNAQSEINTLKQDPLFIDQLGNRNAVGHNEAVERWNHLHSLAFAE